MEYKQGKRALLSVTDKTGLVDFSRQLAGMNVELVSTGGTARTLRDAGLSVRDISDLTGFPEMMDGRVKTLHPMVHGGLLALRDKQDHASAMREHGIAGIDLLVCNLYPFEATVAHTALAMETSRVRVGCLVYSAGYRHPGVMANSCVAMRQNYVRRTNFS